MGDTNIRFALRETQASETDKIISRLRPSHWFRADAVTLSGSSVTALRNLVGTDTLNITAGTMPSPSLSSAFGNKPIIAFSGSQYFDSNLPASTWKFLHDGSGCDVFLVAANTTATTTIAYATRPGAVFAETGFLHSIGVSTGFLQWRALIGNGTSTSVADIIGGTFTLNSASFSEIRYSGAEVVKVALYNKDSVANSVITLGTSPSTADPAGTFRLGAGTSAQVPARMLFADIIIFKRVLTEFERIQVREYIQSRYNISTTTVSSLDKSVIQLSPRNWFRADYYAESAGKIAAFLDKMQPSHALSQASVTNQTPTSTITSSFNDKPVATFTAGQFYDSSWPASNWRFFQDGTGVEIFFVYTPTVSTPNSIYCGTRAGNVAAENGGILISFSTNTIRASWCNGTAQMIDSSNQGSIVRGSPVCANFYYAESTTVNEWNLFLGITSLTSSVTTVQPIATDPQATFRLGAGTGALALLKANMLWADLIIFNRVLTSSERQTMRSYLLSTYRSYSNG